MKLNIFICSIFLLAGLDFINRVDGICFDLVKKFFECQHLKMVRGVGMFGDIEYFSNPNISNNTLDDAFYKRNLSNMTFDQGMDLIRQIYIQTNNCSSEFCKCVSSNIIDKLFPNHSMFFRNATNFPHVKSILAGFNKHYESQLLPLEEIHFWVNFEDHDHMSLAEFCVDLEYTWMRALFYKNFGECQVYNQTVNK